MKAGSSVIMATAQSLCGLAFAGVFNLCNTTLGGGISIIGLPLAVKGSGCVLFVFIVLLIAFLAGYTCDQLRVASELTGINSYTGLAAKMLGPGIAKVQNVIILLNGWGIVVALLQTFEENIPPLFDESSVFHQGWLWVVMATAVVFLPALFIKNIRWLAPLSQIALAAVAAFCVFVISQAPKAATVFEDDASPLWPTGGMDLFNSISLVGLSYACHFNVLPVFNSLERKPQVFVPVLWSAMAATALLYLPIGIIGFLVHPETGGDILFDFKDTKTGTVLGTILAVGLVGTVPLFSLEGIHCSHDLLHALCPALAEKKSSHLVVGTCFLLLGCVVAILVPADGIGVVLGFVGSVCALPLMFIFPPLIYINTFKLLAQEGASTDEPCVQPKPAGNANNSWEEPLTDEPSKTATPFQIGTAWAIFIFGVTASVASFGTNVYSLVS